MIYLKKYHLLIKIPYKIGCPCTTCDTAFAIAVFSSQELMFEDYTTG